MLSVIMHYAKCRFAGVILLSVAKAKCHNLALNNIVECLYVLMLNVANFPFILNVIILTVFMLIVAI
jgi:hypothetical protein